MSMPFTMPDERGRRDVNPDDCSFEGRTCHPPRARRNHRVRELPWRRRFERPAHRGGSSFSSMGFRTGSRVSGPLNRVVTATRPRKIPQCATIGLRMTYSDSALLNLRVLVGGRDLRDSVEVSEGPVRAGA
jgi:hypothetical protein